MNAVHRFYRPAPRVTNRFQRHMESKVCHIDKTVVRIDDILTSGGDDDDHLGNLEELFEVLSKMGAKVNLKKCSFMVPEVEYIGYVISRDGYRITSEEKIEALRKMPEPKTVKELQSFLGGINYYARFIHNMASIAKPIYKLLEKYKKWEWKEKETRAFKLLKSKLSEAPVLCLYDINLPLILAFSRRWCRYITCLSGR